MILFDSTTTVKPVSRRPFAAGLIYGEPSDRAVYNAQAMLNRSRAQERAMNAREARELDRIADEMAEEAEMERLYMAGVRY